uniref:Uncharacterized protein n=1 Tax=Brassica oleracea var. oleracea TaxID=109376 RepID=A0A0D3BWD1_BRAOL
MHLIPLQVGLSSSSVRISLKDEGVAEISNSVPLIPPPEITLIMLNPVAIAAESSQHHLNLLASASSVATTTAVTASNINIASVDLLWFTLQQRLRSTLLSAPVHPSLHLLGTGKGSIVTRWFVNNYPTRNLKFEMYKIETRRKCGNEDRGLGVGGDDEEQDDKMVDKLCLECKPMGTRAKGKEHGDR